MDESLKLSDDAKVLLDRLSRWEREGSLDHLERVLKMANAVLDIMTPEIVEGTVRMAAAGLELADKVANCEVLPMATVMQDVENLLQNPPVLPEHGMRHLWRELHHPDVQRGLAVTLGLLKIVGQRIR